MLPPDGNVVDEAPATMWPFVMVGEDVLGFNFVESVGQHQAKLGAEVKQAQSVVVGWPLPTSIGPNQKLITAVVLRVDVSIEIAE